MPVVDIHNPITIKPTYPGKISSKCDVLVLRIATSSLLGLSAAQANTIGT